MRLFDFFCCACSKKENATSSLIDKESRSSQDSGSDSASIQNSQNILSQLFYIEFSGDARRSLDQNHCTIA